VIEDVAQSQTAQEIMDGLKSDLAYWQRQLRLDNLDISLRFSIPKDANEDGNYDLGFVEVGCGYINYYDIALIPPDKREYTTFNTDYEVILVHELLHVRDVEWMESGRVFKDKKGMLRRTYEWAIDCTAEALVRARRGVTR
jgi:hypothetical protein